MRFSNHLPYPPSPSIPSHPLPFPPSPPIPSHTLIPCYVPALTILHTASLIHTPSLPHPHAITAHCSSAVIPVRRASRPHHPLHPMLQAGSQRHADCKQRRLITATPLNPLTPLPAAAVISIWRASRPHHPVHPIPCYMPDRDFTVPVIVRSQVPFMCMRPGAQVQAAMQPPHPPTPPTPTPAPPSSPPQLPAPTAIVIPLLSYQYGAPADPTIPYIPCYMPDRDIPVPVIVRAQVPFVSPFAAPCKWTAIFRFVASPHKHVRLDTRSRIIQAAKADMAPGWDMFPKSEERTDQDWQHSVFCICLPGHSQWTSRPFKAVISGCIPVTFFREHDNPWHDTLNYDAFSVNIDPDDVPSMRARLEKANVPMLLKGIEQVQNTLNYGAFSVNIDPDDVPTMRERLEKANVAMLQKGVEQVAARQEEADMAMLQKGVQQVQVRACV
ncbi:unnamed protein product [Closterium sp. Naga37s-1]|nr:unnamed protein product [Closterium sp. Naga37s-1]